MTVSLSEQTPGGREVFSASGIDPGCPHKGLSSGGPSISTRGRGKENRVLRSGTQGKWVEKRDREERAQPGGNLQERKSKRE